MKVKEVLEKYGIKPNTELDQHFLADEKAAKSAVKLLKVKPTDCILEIGPGIGTLTEHIPSCTLVYAVDIDNTLLAVLKKEVNTEHVKTINANALAEFDKLRFNKIISSTPYSICEPLLHKLFIAQFDLCVLIVPSKFAEIASKPKTKLGFYSSWFLSIETKEEISRDLFYPKPRVDSVVLLITKKPKSIEQELYLQKDKKTKNAIREILIKKKSINKKKAREYIEKNKIPEKILEKNLSTLQFAELKKISEFITNAE